jgi:hypothetical protein
MGLSEMDRIAATIFALAAAEPVSTTNRPCGPTCTVTLLPPPPIM